MERVKPKTTTNVEEIPESGFVTVASKLPNGLVLQLCQKEKVTEAAPGGSRTSEVYRKYGTTYTLNKARVAWGEPPEYKIVAGYALTENIPAEFWNEWLRQNADMDMVKKRIVFAYEKEQSAVSAAREHREVRSGLEPISQDGDPRMPKGIKKAEKKELQDAG